MKIPLLILLIRLSLAGQTFTADEVRQWREQAMRVNIIKDDWGVPHIFGKTDDCIFCLAYSKAEDIFDQLMFQLSDSTSHA